MVLGSIVDLASGLVQSLFHGSSSTSTTTPANTSGASSFGEILSSVQQLEQSSQAQYQHVGQKIAGYLQTGAQAATSSGDTALASRLTQLSTDFSNGQFPNL